MLLLGTPSQLLHSLVKKVRRIITEIFLRTFFFVSFVIAFSFSMVFTHNIYMNWSLVPVIVSKSPSVSSVDSLPFPAITVCNLNLASASKVKDIKRGTQEHSILETYCSSGLEFDAEIDYNKTINNWPKYREFIRNVSILSSTYYNNANFRGWKRMFRSLYALYPSLVDLRL